MSAVDRPCLNRGPGCRELPGYCFTDPAGHTDQGRLHAHWGMTPGECRVCGQPHDGERNSLCRECVDRVDAEGRVSSLHRHRMAVLSNPHLDFADLTDSERFQLEHEEIT